MSSFGSFLICLAWLLSIIGVCSGIYAGRTRSSAWTETARQATLLVALGSVMALALLGYLFCTSDFSNQYVWQFSNRDMFWVYKISAIWGGMDGSMLLWAGILACSSSFVALFHTRYPRELMPWVYAILNSSTLFFLTVVVFVTNPFRYIKAGFIPPDGNGLNPLLQNPLMAIHPPTLYLGFTTFAVPYAFCLAALLCGSLNTGWIRATRRWTLVAWLFLTSGIVLGGHWAYIELGWGGFWAWDPVENSSFFPWLTATAYLHSVLVQERKGMLKAWSVWLIVLTYALTVFGTFLTRSGVVQSVHAFASTDVGWVFLLYLGLIISATIALTLYRRKELRPDRQIESAFSREAVILVNNLLLLSICFATIWGVMFPVFSEAITGTKQAVGIPFFNTINVPLFLALLLAMGIGPLIAWRKTSISSLKRLFLWPTISAFVVGGILLWAGITGFYPLLSYLLCVFITVGLFGELHRGVSQQKISANEKGSTVARTAKLFSRHRERYAGHLVHFGVVVATLGITASMAHKIEREFSLAPGESIEISHYRFTLDGMEDVSEPNYQGLAVVVGLSTAGSADRLATMRPELRRYTRNQETTTEVALRMSMRDDVYLVVAGLDESGNRAALKLFINPLQVWLWIGTLIIILGTLLIIIPFPRRALTTTDHNLLDQGVR